MLKNRKFKLVPGVIAALLLQCSSHLFAAEKTIVLDGGASGRIFEGLGAVSAGASSRLLIDYPEPYRSQILDYLFKPGYGAALQHLKVEIGGDVNSTDGSEPSHERSRSDRDYTRGYEWWLMEQARKRNPNIILDSLPWGAPGWIGGGHIYSADMAAYVADFIKGAKQFHNLNIRYTGVWNERPYDPAYVKLLHRTLVNEGLSAKIVCCDDYHRDKQFEVIYAMQRDLELATSVAEVGVHYPWSGAREGYSTTPQAKASGKTLWSSEDQPNTGGGPYISRDWKAGGRILAEVYNRNYVDGAFTKTEIWSPITSYFENLAAPHSGLMIANTPWSGHYEVQSTIWVTAHTTQFADPGWQYMDSASGHLPGNTGTYVSLKSPRSYDWSIIVETIQARVPQRLHFVLKAGLSTAKVHVWQTNSQRTFEHVIDLTPSENAFTYTFEPDSLYSLTTRDVHGKGTIQPPPGKPFPLPYEDTFEQTAVNKTPKYLSDQDGAFEVHSCQQRSGRCLEQVITEKPIPWSPLPEPFTLTGDANRSDYIVAVDALYLTANHVTIMGRIDSADVFKDEKALFPSGYILQVGRDDAWRLLSAAYKAPVRVLASGSAPVRGGWHRLALRFNSDQITAFIDGKQICTVRDSAHKSGMFAVGTDWGRAQFDNLKVER
jgi:hypothetical protein